VDAFLYVLRDSKNDVRYVGITTSPLRRYASHLRARRRRLRSACWIRSLLRQGIVPTMDILCRTDVERARLMEAIIIRALRERDGNVLTNLTDGGEVIMSRVRRRRKHRRSRKLRELPKDPNVQRETLYRELVREALKPEAAPPQQENQDVRREDA
jgi:hypothetical protein